MSEVKKPMKTQTLKEMLDAGKKLAFKIPDYRGGNWEWRLVPWNDPQTEEDKYRLMVNGKFWDEIETWKSDNVYTQKKIKDWTEQEKLINQDFRSLLRLDKPIMGYTNVLSEYLVENKVKQKPQTFNKKVQRKIRNKNNIILNKQIRKIHHAHQTNCVNLGKKRKQTNTMKKFTDYIVKIKFVGTELKERSGYISKEGIFKKYPNFKNPIYKRIKANNSVDAYNKIRDVYKSAELEIKEWSGTEGTPWRTKSRDEAPRPLKTDNKDLRADLRMVCIKHDTTWEVKRLKKYQADKIISKDAEWSFCGKQEYKTYCGKLRYLQRAAPKDGLHKGPFTGDIFTRRNGTRVRKQKGVKGNRNVVSQQIKISNLNKDEDGNFIPTKKKIVTTKDPLFYYVEHDIKNKKGESFGIKVKKYLIDHDSTTSEIEYTPVKKHYTKTIKIYNVPKKPKVELTVKEIAQIKGKKQEILLERIKRRKVRNASRLANKLKKKHPHLSNKDKIKLARMLRIKPKIK